MENNQPEGDEVSRFGSNCKTSTLLISYLDYDAMLSFITKREGDKVKREGDKQSKTPSHCFRGVHRWHKGCSFKKKKKNTH